MLTKIRSHPVHDISKRFLQLWKKSSCLSIKLRHRMKPNEFEPFLDMVFKVQETTSEMNTYL